MQNMKPNMRPAPMQQKNMGEMIAKYKSLLWQNKYWIIGITSVVTVLWLIIFSTFLSQRIEYTSSVTIKFDDPRRSSTSGVTDFAQFGSEGKVAILYTNTFLASVVDSLNLNLFLSTPGINRFEFFKQIKLGKESQIGNYRLVVSDGNMTIFYTNKLENIEDLPVYESAVSASQTMDIGFNGIELEINPTILEQHQEIEFSYADAAAVSSSLREKLIGTLDRSRTILLIEFTYNDPHAAAFITNTIAKLFIETLLEHKRFRTSSILTTLEDQLGIADKSLKESEQRLRKFRERNPYLLLSGAGSSIVTDLSDKNSQLTIMNRRINKINALREQKARTAPENVGRVYLQLVSFTEEENIATDQVILTQYTDLSNEKSSLLAEGFSGEHPRIIEIDKKLSNLQSEIDINVQAYFQELQASKRKLQSEIRVSNRNLTRLPRGELELAELQQDREVKSQIYSNILIRFNEAKISDASIISDAFIIDEAKAPIVFGDIRQKLIQLFLGPILGLVLGIGLFVFLDLLDDTVKKRDEIEFKLRLPVLSIIPVIIDEKEIPDDIDIKGQLDYKLVTSDYSPSIAGEKFRLLRTKLLHEEEISKKPLVLSSLAPGDGKSLIAANLAIAFAQQKIPTVLIDADLRRGVLHNTLNSNKKPGLSDILASSKTLEEHQMVNSLQKTHVPYLSFIACGIQIPNPSELLGGTQMDNLLSYLKEQYEIIIFDTPPIEYIPDALVLNSKVHNLLLVVRWGKTHMNKLSDKVSDLAHIKDDFRGIIINASQDKTEKDQYSYSYYHY